MRSRLSTNGDECQYLHVDPSAKIQDCPWYARGFCKHGPGCRHRHSRKVLCQNYLCGFCPEGPNCKAAHPNWDTVTKIGHDGADGSTQDVIHITGDGLGGLTDKDLAYQQRQRMHQENMKAQQAQYQQQLAYQAQQSANGGDQQGGMGMGGGGRGGRGGGRGGYEGGRGGYDGQRGRGRGRGM
ncbi:hypothetical protein SARC_09581 [Sphaeroforma arctica JP610]|uniref:C3H1-type domain-containing protein n=1 Tax=Sphaeroforma arctica JP610 TaxID=667725 RepID=A0A0L0FMI6_9EUKA|nr:hypothetical protein SARC_09581 [Sphaeroforma arctica JP610]KNC77970.1 hypothetical protein SARC_09581 [Sphaeroforma arctica JP610]|eukprot:XP_014151872.1 hypothetical protein SARC_09581 [Sphaeroforma arctica JP610]